MSSLTKRFLQVFALVAVAIAGGAQSPTQNAAPTKSTTSSPTEQPDLTIKAKTQVVLLDVVATDKKGNPITDLKKDDFTIVESGKPQTLASFNMIDIAKRGQAYKSAPPQKMPPGVYSNKQQAVEQQGQLTVLLLDALNTPWQDQAYARSQMLKYLRNNRADNGAMAIYFLGNKLMRLQDFTTDPALLQQVLQKHRGATSPLIDNPDEPGVDTSNMTAEMAAGVAAMEEQEAAIRMDIRKQLTLDALRAIGRILSGYPGRKKLIWVSGAFPITIEPGENSGFNSQRSYGNDVMETTALLRDSQVAVYTIDAAGLVGLATSSAQFSGRGSNGRVMTGSQLASVNRSRLNALNDAHFTAKTMAEGTGGLAFYNRNDLDTAVMKSVADGAIYYALSYSPDDKNWDGKYRRIEVKVNRLNVELRYRKGYFARDPEAIRLESSAVIQGDLDNAMMSLLTASGVTFYGSALPLEPPAKTGEAPNPNAIKMAEVRFLVEPRDIFFQASADNKKKCSIQFAVGVFNSEKIVKSAGKRLECNVNPDTYAKLLHDGILFEVPVEVTQEKARIRLLVRDNLSGKIGSVDVPYPSPGTTQASK